MNASVSVGATDNLLRVIRASRLTGSTRACLLTTRDREHAINTIRGVAAEAGVTLYHFTVSGRRRYNPKELRWEHLGGESLPLDLLRAAQELREGVVLMEEVVRQLGEKNGDSLTRMQLAQMLSGEAGGGGVTLIFVEDPGCEASLPAMLAGQFVRLEVAYPRTGELEVIARQELARLCHHARVGVDVERLRIEAKRLASGLAGLTHSAARDALRDALSHDVLDFASARERLERRKAAQISRELSMNVLDTETVEPPIGLDYLVEHMRLVKNRMRISGSQRARGVLLVGPPGTGKTMLARAIGAMVELPVVEFQISSLINSYLGETEQRFAHAFATLEAMAPNVVFVDEIDKAFGGDGAERDGGTMARCTGSLLTWLSTNPEPNYVIATTNDLKRMGETGLAMTRSERFDAMFFVDVPGLASRRIMLERWLAGRMEGHEDAARRLADITEKFSGADLYSLVKQAQARADFEGRPLALDLLKAEVERRHTRALAMYDEFQALRRWGRQFCEPAGPPEN